MRGFRRLEAIIEAAFTILAEVGYDALTLTSVAERSDSAIPSLYRFFANKNQLMDALADRVALRIRSIASEVLAPSSVAETLDAFVHTLVAQLEVLVGEFPGLAQIMGRFEQRHHAVDVDIAKRLGTAIAARAPHLTRNERAGIVLMTMTMVRAGVQLLSNSPTSQRRTIIPELERALAAYLHSRIG